MRITAFILRALLASVEADAENLNVLLAYEIIYNTGFFGLLYSVYTLVTERYVLLIPRQLSPHSLQCLPRKKPPTWPHLSPHALPLFVPHCVDGRRFHRYHWCHPERSRNHRQHHKHRQYPPRGRHIHLPRVRHPRLSTDLLPRPRRVFRYDPPSPPSPSLPFSLTEDGYRGSTNQIGSNYGIYFLLVMSLLLVVREAFFTATVSNTTQQNNEALWYPLAVVTEFIVVVLFATPGLVPDLRND